MSAVLRNSTLYTKLHVNKYLGDARERGGRVVPIPFELTIVSPATVADSYNLCVLPAYCRVIALIAVAEAMGLSAGGGTTFAIGDSGDADRYMAATDMDVLNAAGVLASAGMNYEPTADTIVVGVVGGAAMVAGKTIKGCFLVVPAA